MMIAVCSCDQPSPGPEPEQRARNLLLITVDTLRPDHLGIYGYGRNTSPNVDGLAADGVVFWNAYSQAGWTTPSMATVMTGLYPDQHGATRFDTPIRAGARTLAERLRRAGYETHAYVSHSLVGRHHGFDRGFDSFDASVLRRGHPGEITTSKELTDHAIWGLDALREPYFLWIHYMDPHQVYLRHQVFDFGDSKRDRYDSEVAHNDHQIGRLLRAMEQKGLLEDTVVVFTADHGEELEEHGVTGHFTLLQEVLRIPLVIRAPGLGPLRVDARVSQVDLLPTLLPLLGLVVESDLVGRDVLAGGLEEAPVFSTRVQPNAYRQRSVIVGDYKLVCIDDNPAPAPAASDLEYDSLARLEPGLRLFDLRRDPGETMDLASEHPRKALELLEMIEKRFPARDDASAGRIDLDAEWKAELRSLGYIE